MGTTPMDPATNRPHRNVKRLGDLLIPESNDVLQDDRDSIFRCQLT